MSIKPVDMQVIVPKSSEILKSDNNLANRHDKNQLDFSNIIKKQTDNKENQVFELNKTENNINTDKKRENNKKRNKNKKNKKNNETTSIYDISV